MGRNMVTRSNWGLANAVDMILYISLYFSWKVLLIQQIGSIRAVIKGHWGWGFFPATINMIPNYFCRKVEENTTKRNQ